MTGSPQTSVDGPFGPRSLHLVGRQTYVDAIKAAIEAPGHRAQVLYFVGPGGIGKTRLLEEVGALQKSWHHQPFLWSGIIDLYHAEFHSPGGLRDGIVSGLDPDNNHFKRYREAHAEFNRKRREGVTGQALEKIRRELDVVFQEEYALLAVKQRLVLCFDTLELVQYESDIIQELCQVDDIDTIVKNWLLEQISRLPNTVTLFAGRPRERVQAAFEEEFTTAGCKFTLFTIESFTSQEIREYLNMVRKERPELEEVLTPEAETWISRRQTIRPIYLTLLLDLLAHRKTLTDIFPPSVLANQEVEEGAIRQQLVEHLRSTEHPDPFYQMVYFLMYARKGLDADLLRHLMGTEWTEDEIAANIHLMSKVAFVKTRPGTELLFLHDEVYDLCDLYFRDDPRFGQEYTPIAEYYRQRLKDASSPQEREDIMLTSLYYELQVDADAGYHKYYAFWDEEAIKSHETGFDMRLRDETLRFIDRYVRRDSLFYDPRIAESVDQNVIDRDCAVRWVKRLLARGDYDKACEVAARVRASTDPAFDWEKIAAPLYKAGLLAAWGEALVFTSAPEEHAHDLLEQAVQLLGANQEWTERQRPWYTRILGRSHNYLGYLYRTRGRYGLALQEYRKALSYEADILSERADTLNNLAYLLALLGRAKQALRHLEQALAIRNELAKLRQGGRYPIALGRNTRGRIYTLQDHPMWGLQECLEALRLCEEIPELRGVGLACNGVGFALRKRGDQWKYGVYTHEEAQDFFREAIQYFQRAATIFSDQIREPIRLWEAWNELGSLYCDWGWLARAQKDSATALDFYAQSIGFQEKALDIANQRSLEFQIADSYDDLAQVYGDQSFLLAELGQIEEARESRVTAENYLDQAEERVPISFRLMPGIGFPVAPEPGEAHWLSLGKAYQWRGVWGFRDLEHGIVDETKREEILRKATRNLILAGAYFQQYWPASFAMEHSLDYFGGLLQSARVPATWAHEQVQVVADEYQVNLEMLDKTIDDILGL